ATCGGWRAAGVRDGVTGTLMSGAPASYAVWDARPLRNDDDPLPRCLRTVHRGEVIHG
ncbi:MAG: amidohydrolase, partial [Mycobacterium sp.]